MTAERVTRFSEIGWWPSPAHCAVMMQIARDSYKEADPVAPPECAGMIRVRTTQDEIADILNVTPKTVRRVFSELRAMGILKQPPGRRTWYMHRNVDSVTKLTDRLRSEWPKLKAAQRAGAPDPSEDGGDELPWYVEDEAAESSEPSPEGYDRSGREPASAADLPAAIRELIAPSNPPDAFTRVRSAITSVAQAHGKDPRVVHDVIGEYYGGTEGAIRSLRSGHHESLEAWLSVYVWHLMP